jgi:hypothetical protein
MLNWFFKYPPLLILGSRGMPQTINDVQTKSENQNLHCCLMDMEFEMRPRCLI